MTDNTKLNILSKISLNNFSSSTVPAKFEDDNIYPATYNKVGAITYVDGDDPHLKFPASNSKLTVNTFTLAANYLRGTNFQVEGTLLLETLKYENNIFSFAHDSNVAQSLVIIIRNTYKDGISIKSNNISLSANYKFKENTKYHISVSKYDDTYTFYINGSPIGFKTSSTFTASLQAGTTFVIGSPTVNDTSNFMVGNLYNANLSIGQTIIHSNAFTTYGNNLISKLNFSNKEYNDTASIFYPTIECIENTPVTWTYQLNTIKNGYLKLNNNTITTTYSGDYTLSFLINQTASMDNIAVFKYNNYTLTINIDIVDNTDVHKVVVNEYTTAALDFENGLEDQISSTIWQKSGTADITTTNKIYGSTSFETKSLNDSLYTNSNVITGNGKPYTVEYTFLYKGKNVPNNDWDAPIFTRYSSGDIGNYLNTSTQNISFHSVLMGLTNSATIFGKHKLKPNEINKVTMTYDCSAIRIFINDELDNTLGTNMGFITTGNQPYRFLSRYANDQSSNITSSTNGLIDHINIHDGIATKVRSSDPYENYLITDLSFDGENNSTKIIDNAMLYQKTTDEHFKNNTLLINGDYSKLLDVTGNSTITLGETFISTNRTPKFSKKCIALNSNNIGIRVAIPVIGLQAFTMEMWIDSINPIRDWARFFEVGGEGITNANFYVCNNSYSNPAKPELGMSYPPSASTVYSTDSFIQNAWNHLCIMRDEEKNIYMFLNGVLQQKIDSSVGALLNISGNLLRIGESGHQVGLARLDAFIDSIRITVGVARYTVGGFALPTEGFSYDKKNKWNVSGNAKLSTAQPFAGFSSLKIESSSFISSDGDNIMLENKDFSIMFDATFTSIPASTIWNIFFSNKREADDQHSDYFQFVYYNNKLTFLYANNTGTVEYIKNEASFTPTINTIYKINLSRKDNNIYLYVNDLILNVTAVMDTNKSLDIYNIAVGSSYWHSNNNYHRGHIKNFKIYKGVAVLPESPVGKIQLDFDNNLNDKYGNSTCTNYNATFDSANSVKGYAVKLTGDDNSYITCGAAPNLNFEDKNFEINIDFKSLDMSKQYVFGLATNHTTYDNATTIQFGLGGTIKGLMFNKPNVVDLTNFIWPVANQYYNAKIKRHGTVFSAVVNDTLCGQYITSNSTNTINLNHNNVTRIGNIGWGSGFGLNGYIDNFKSYKEDLISEYTNRYGVKLKVEYNNEDLVLKCTEYLTNPMYWHTVEFKDFILPLNFIIEIDTYFSSDNTSLLTLIYKTSQPYSLNQHGNFGYCLDIGSTVWFGRGSNTTAPNSGDQLFQSSNTSFFRDNKYHKVKLIVNGNNHKLYIDDTLYIDVNDSLFSNIRSTIALSSANNAITNRNMRIKSIDIYDLGENLLYHKDFKSKIENPIAHTAVHLPLETNANNIGFTNLTINSIGNPTYHVIDGKKCIKIEADKYLTINSNNIFNLGSNTDFYIELDIYVQDITPINWQRIFCINSSLQQILALRSVEYGDGYLYFGNTRLVYKDYLHHKWTNIKIKRNNGIISILVDDVVFLSNETFNFTPYSTISIGTDSGYSTPNTDFIRGYISNFKMFVGTSEIPESYNEKAVLDLDFAPTRKSYLFKDNNNKCVIHPVNITQRDYKDSQYCCSFNGTNQYLQLGKNELFNFGRDDFIIYFKCKFEYDSIGTYQYILASNISTSNGNGTCGIARDNNSKLFIIFRDASNEVRYISNMVLASDTMYEIHIIRSTDRIIVICNDEVIAMNITGSVIPSINFAANNNTYIGRSGWDQSPLGHFKGAIYSIKVFRNTSDISLLDDPTELINIGDESSKQYILSNGVDSVDYTTNVINEDFIKIMKSEDSIVAVIGEEILELPTVSIDEFVNDDQIVLFDEYIGNVKDINLYDTIVTDDSFEYDGPYDTAMPYLETIDDQDEYLVVDNGHYIIKGYLEGLTEPHKWQILNKYTNVVLAEGFGYEYYFDGIDPLYKDDYIIRDYTINKDYPISEQGEPGSISLQISVNLCEDSDLCIHLYERGSSQLVGKYEIVKVGNPYTCVISYLDTNKKYDVMLFDRNNIIESRMMSNRSPTNE